jgi:hypothetical protein
MRPYERITNLLLQRLSVEVAGNARHGIALPM